MVKIFHVNVRHYGKYSHSNKAQCKDVLLVRWFGCNLNYHSGFGVHHLPRIEFLHENNPDVFSFLNPEVIICGVHLIPTFSLGWTSELLGPSIAWEKQDRDEDWQSYDVNMYVLDYIRKSMSLLSPYILLAYSTSTYFYIILIYNQLMLFTSWEHWNA